MKNLFYLLLTIPSFFLASCSKEDNKLVCGVTIFENMNEKDANGNWTGFESEFAIEVGKIIGMDVEFQEIEWEQKYNDNDAMWRKKYMDRFNGKVEDIPEVKKSLEADRSENITINDLFTPKA